MSKLAFESNVSGTGTFTITSPNSDTDRAITLPDLAGDFVVNEGAETLTINSTAIFVGTDSSTIAGDDASANNTGLNIFQTGRVQAAFNGGDVLRLNRLTSDGDIMQFRKDGSTVGSIGSRSGIYIAGTSVGLGFKASDIRPTDSTGNVTNGALDLGDAATRFKDLYLSGGVYLGGTGSANHLDDYEEGTYTPTIVSGVNSVTYNQNDGYYTKIGRSVTATIFMTFSAISGSGSTTTISLPFTASSESPKQCMGSVLIDNLSTASDSTAVQVGTSSSSVTLLKFTNGGTGAHGGLGGNALTTSTSVRITVTYDTAS